MNNATKAASSSVIVSSNSSMPHIPIATSPTMSKSQAISNKEQVPEGKSRFVPIIPKPPLVPSVLSSDAATREVNIKMSIKNDKSAINDSKLHNYISPHKLLKNAQPRKESDRYKKHAKQTPKNVTLESKFQSESKRQNIKPNTSYTKIRPRIQPKPVQSTKAETDPNLQKSEDPPQISILDEAMEAWGIDGEHSAAGYTMVDGIMPMKGSDLKDMINMNMNPTDSANFHIPATYIDQTSDVTSAQVNPQATGDYEIPTSNEDNKGSSHSVSQKEGNFPF